MTIGEKRMKADKDHVYVKSERLEECVINALEWAIEVSEQTTFDLIRAMGITSDELDAIGYEKENFQKMHDATGD